MTCIVAVYNGAPLLFPDSFYYLRRALAFVHGANSIGAEAIDLQQAQASGSPAFSSNPFFLRPVPYTIFLVPFANSALIYAVPFVQGLLVAYLVFLALKVARIRVQPIEFIVLFLLLSLASSLPWYSGQIMPDIFTSMVILLFFVLMFGTNELSRFEQAFGALLLAGALGTHLSHLSLFVGLAAVFGAYWLLFDRKLISFSNFAVLIVGPLVLVMLMLTASNYVFSRKATLSESSDLLLLARLVNDGTVQSYLREACPEKSYLLCAEQDELQNRDAEGFLWDPDGAWHKYQSNPAFLTEAQEIIRGTLARDLLTHVRKSVDHFLAQLVTIDIDPDFTGRIKTHGPIPKEVDPLADRIHLMDGFGRDLSPLFEDARQMRQDMPLFDLANRLQVAGVVISVLILCASLPFLIVWREKACLLFIAVVVTGVVGNAAGLGALSIVVAERYQNRVVWLLPLAAFVAVLHIARRLAVQRPKSYLPQPVGSTD